MIFQHTIDKVLSGVKTQTRRIVKPGKEWFFYAETAGISITTAGGYSTGKTYAVQPGRGKNSVARIKITDIRREDVRLISDEDAEAEGFDNRHNFFWAWMSMHDPKALKPFFEETDFIDNTETKFLSTRPAERYQAWVLTFKLVEVYA